MLMATEWLTCRPPEQSDRFSEKHSDPIFLNCIFPFSISIIYRGIEFDFRSSLSDYNSISFEEKNSIVEIFCLAEHSIGNCS